MPDPVPQPDLLKPKEEPKTESFLKRKYKEQPNKIISPSKAIKTSPPSSPVKLELKNNVPLEKPIVTPLTWLRYSGETNEPKKLL